MQAVSQSPADPCLELELELARVHLGRCPTWQSAYWVMGPTDTLCSFMWPPSPRSRGQVPSAYRFIVSRMKYF